MTTLIKFLTLVLAAITMSALIAHLMAAPAKFRLEKEPYFLVQSIYRGWNLIGIAELAAMLLTTFWLVKEWKTTTSNLLMVSTACFTVSLVIFFLFTFPANQATQNWTYAPPDWKLLRTRWEYSHAIRALLNLTGFFFLVGVVFKSG